MSFHELCFLGSQVSDGDGDGDDCVILEIKSFDDLKTNNLNTINHSRGLSGKGSVVLKTPLSKKVFGGNDLSIDRSFDNESCKTLNISKPKPHEYIYINDDDDNDDGDDDNNCNDRDDYVIIIEAKAFEDEIIHKLASLPMDGNLDSNASSEDELAIIAERGQVACRDYPHSRHACAEFPFNTTPHESHCSQCYCYVCDVKSPCAYWEQAVQGHCDASEFEVTWKEMREIRFQVTKIEK